MVIWWKAGRTDIPVQSPYMNFKFRSLGVKAIQKDTEFLKVNYAGALILLACILGGGTPQGLWTDHLIQIAMIPAILIGLTGVFRNRLGAGANILAVGILFVLTLQFVPFSPPRDLIDPIGVPSAFEFWTLSPSRSLESAAFLGAVLGFGMFVGTLEETSQKRLIRFVFLGLAINLVVGIIQLSFSGRTNVGNVFPFVIKSALFANENHFSSFVFAIIPIIAWQLLTASKRLVFFIAVSSLVVAILFAVGSRAGMAISAGLSIFSLFWFLLPDKKVIPRLALFAISAIILVISDFGIALEADLRSVFFKNTMAAISNYWKFGTGLGTFPIIYPQYESTNEVIRVFANHAHNDYLEIFLETGMLGVLLLLGFLALTARSFLESPLAQAAGLSILAVLFHSGIDYPLRTMAIATLFATFSAIAFSRPKTNEQT